VVVIINRSSNNIDLQVELQGNSKTEASVYETSDNMSLSKRPGVDLKVPFSVPQRSISTLVITQ